MPARNAKTLAPPAIVDHAAAAGSARSNTTAIAPPAAHGHSLEPHGRSSMPATTSTAIVRTAKEATTRPSLPNTAYSHQVNIHKH